MFARSFVKKCVVVGPLSFRGAFRFHSTAVFTWGAAEKGALGHKNYDDITREPRRLVKSKRFKEVSCGEHYSLAVDHDGNLFGWGTGPKSFDSPTPMPIAMPGNAQVAKVVAGPRHASCIDTKGNLYTWGKQKSGWFSGGGQLGHGDSLTSTDEPTLMEAVREYGAKVTNVSCGSEHTLILTDDGEVLSCGVGEYGRLGAGMSKDLYIPASLDSLENVKITQVAAGFNHSMALSDDGSVYSWGRNDAGQLGFSDTYIDIYSMEEYPRKIDQEAFGGKKIIHIAASNCRSAAVSDDGQVYIWGRKQNHYPTLIATDAKFTSATQVRKVVLGKDESDRFCGFLLDTKDSLWSYGEYKTNMTGHPTAPESGLIPSKIKALEGMKVLDVDAGVGHCAAVVETTDGL